MMKIHVDSTMKYQQIFGFGAAFTDAAGIVLNTLNAEAREQMLRAYWNREKG